MSNYLPPSGGPEQILYENHFMGTSIKVYPDRVEFKKVMQSLQSIPISQITNTRLTMGEIIIEAVSGHYSIATPKQKEVQQAISLAQQSSLLPQPAMPVQQGYYPPQQPIPVYQQQMPPQSMQPPQMETQIKTYKDTHEFQRDQKRMTKQRWTVQSTMSHQPRRSVAGLLFVPFAAMRPPKPQIVVTYQRPVR